MKHTKTSNLLLFSCLNRFSYPHICIILDNIFIRQIYGVDGDVNNDGQGGETHTLANVQVTAMQEAIQCRLPR